jgi:hypothetical protein
VIVFDKTKALRLEKARVAMRREALTLKHAGEWFSLMKSRHLGGLVRTPVDQVSSPRVVKPISQSSDNSALDLT